MTALHPLAQGVPHPAPLRHRANPAMVLAGVAAAPAAWSLQLLLSYGLNGDRCASPGSGFSAISLLLLAIGIVALACCIFGLSAAVGTWQRTRGEAPGGGHAGLSAGLGRTRFLGLCGVVASAIFTLGVMFALLIPFLVSPCAG